MSKAMFVLDPSVNPDQLASFCVETGVESPILNPSFFSDDRFLDALRGAGLKLWLNLPVFFDEKYLSEHPEAYSISTRGNRAIHSWLHMVCPSRQEFLDRKRQEFGELLCRTRPDCVSYDFIRFYVFWEEVGLLDSPDAIEHGCYCPVCREGFARSSGERLELRDGVIEPRQRKPLGLWKRSVIENTVRSLNATVVGSRPVFPGIPEVPLQFGLDSTVRFSISA